MTPETTGASASSGGTPPHVFISYASADRERVLPIADVLEARGVPVWVDRKSIAGGQSWTTEIVRGVKSCGVLIVACTVQSVASRNVRQEVQLAWESDRPILPVLLEKVTLPEELQYATAGRQWVDISDRPEAQWLPELLAALAHLGVATVKAAPSAGATGSAGVTVPGEPGGPAAGKANSNLPTFVSSFVGREEILGRAREAVQRARLYTVTGTGGVGKSRLAVEVGRGLLEAFSDGVWHVDLAGATDPDLVANAVADVFGLREQKGRPLEQALTDSLQGKNILIILDNCEHLVAACAGLASRLLKSCAGLHILAASREVFGAKGEEVLNLPPLYAPQPDRLPSLDKLRQYGAVALFIDRAQAVMPDFELTSDNAWSVAEICHSLDGIPLAVELAAARARVLSPEQIAARLDDRFRLLRGSSRDVLPRQQTLQALVDWSYDLLSDKEKLLWRRLSVFRGGFTLSAAETVCAGGDIEDFEILDLISGLVEKSLATSTQSGRELRYRFFETLRRYGAEKLAESGEADTVHGRYIAWCSAFLDGMDEQGDVRREGGRLLDPIEEEYENLKAALAWCLEAKQEETALRLAAGLWGFWFWRHETEGYRTIEGVLARTSQTPSLRRGQVVFSGGRMALARGDFATATVRIKEALAIAKSLNAASEMTDAYNGLGLISTNAGDHTRAKEYFEEGLRIAREARLSTRISRTLINNLAISCMSLGETDRCRELFIELRTLSAKAGDKLELSFACSNLSEVLHLADGDLERAEELAHEALDTSREIGFHRGEGFGLVRLGAIHLDSGRLAEAGPSLREGFRRLWELGEYADLVESLLYFSRLILKEGHPDRAATLLGAAEAHFRASTGLKDLESLPPEEVRYALATRDEIKASIGEEAYAAAWQAGLAHTWEETARFALGEEVALG